MGALDFDNIENQKTQQFKKVKKRSEIIECDKKWLKEHYYSQFIAITYSYNIPRKTLHKANNRKELSTLLCLS